MSKEALGGVFFSYKLQALATALKETIINNYAIVIISLITFSYVLRNFPTLVLLINSQVSQAPRSRFLKFNNSAKYLPNSK